MKLTKEEEQEKKKKTEPIFLKIWRDKSLSRLITLSILIPKTLSLDVQERAKAHFD